MINSNKKLKHVLLKIINEIIKSNYFLWSRSKYGGIKFIQQTALYFIEFQRVI